MPPSAPRAEKRNAALRRVHVLVFGSAGSQLSTVINPPPPLPGPARAEHQPRGVLGVPHWRGVRRRCDGSMDYMYNETESTRRTGNTDQPLRCYRRENCDGRCRCDAETPAAWRHRFHAIYCRKLMEWRVQTDAAPQCSARWFFGFFFLWHMCCYFFFLIRYNFWCS